MWIEEQCVKTHNSPTQSPPCPVGAVSSAWTLKFQPTEAVMSPVGTKKMYQIQRGTKQKVLL